MILENRNIIVFADDWGRHPSTMQHLGKVLAEKNRLLWVGSLALRKPELGLKDFYRLVEKLKKIFSKTNELLAQPNEANVVQVHPFAIPFHDISVIHLLNNFLLRKTLKKKIAEFSFEQAILITSSPVMYDLVGKLNETSAHYICLDDYSLFKNAFKSLTQFETRLLEKVNSAFSVSKPLLESRIPKSGVNSFLPQGVDLEHFTVDKVVKSEYLKGVKSPIIGFFGLLSEWVDLELIKTIAETFPVYSIVLIGDHSVDISSLTSHNNIYLLGKIPYSNLPSVAASFSVGIIPFKVNDLTAAVNPLKLVEYLALGLPVVTTPMDEVEKFKEYICISGNIEEFTRMVGEEILSDNDTKKTTRKQIASQYSWKGIADKIGEVILSTEKRIVV